MEEENKQENQEINEIELLKNQLKQEQEKTKRVAADCANELRKMQIQLDDLRKFGISSFAKRVIDGMSILEIALKSVKEEDRKNNQELDFLYQGLNMSVSAIHKAFNEMKINKIEANIGDAFDFNKHDAIETEESELDENKITNIIKHGYTIHDRILMPSVVKVSKKKEDKAE